MTGKDILFKVLTKEELATKPQDEISHFGWEGKGSFAFMCNADAYYESAETLYNKMREVGKVFSVLDGHIYPLIFLYRHFMELYIKGLYLKYSADSEEDIKSYLSGAGHNLNVAWEKVKPLLSKGKKHVGSSQNIGAIEHYINEMNKFDATSMLMRYPATKDLSKMHTDAIHLDYINLHDRMAEFYHAIHQLDYDIDNQINTLADENEINEFVKHYNLQKPTLDRFIAALKREVSAEHEECNTSDRQTTSERLLEKIKKNRDRAIRRQNGEWMEDDYMYIYENSGDDFKIIVESLFYAGRSVKERIYNLSKKPTEHRAEFITCCIMQMKDDGMEFGKEVKEYQTNVFTKSADAILANIEKAINIIEKQ